MVENLDRLHARLRRAVPLQRLAIISRILLALAFIPTGTVKMLGQRFTLLPTDNPVGYFFEAMYQTGYYWNFLGIGQVVAGLLLLIPATATLGAVAFFPIILNVTVVTWSIGFKGTIYITALMLLASIFLLAWDWDRLRAIVFAPPIRPAVVAVVPMVAFERAGYVLGTAAAMVVLLAIRGLAPTATIPWMLGVGGLAAVMVLAGWVQAGRRAAR